MQVVHCSGWVYNYGGIKFTISTLKVAFKNGEFGLREKDRLCTFVRGLVMSGHYL
jgi:hypothetical protein